RSRMHYIHALLVKLKYPSAELAAQSLEALRAHVRKAGEAALLPFEGRVWDWYSRTDAGRWAARYPPVMLVLEDPDQFFTLFDEFRAIRLKAARERLALALHDEDRFRTPEEIAAAPGCEPVPSELLVYPFEGPKGQVYSGIPRLPPVLDYALLERAFNERGR